MEQLKLLITSEIDIEILFYSFVLMHYRLSFIHIVSELAHPNFLHIGNVVVLAFELHWHLYYISDEDIRVCAQYGRVFSAAAHPFDEPRHMVLAFVFQMYFAVFCLYFLLYLPVFSLYLF